MSLPTFLNRWRAPVEWALGLFCILCIWHIIVFKICYRLKAKKGKSLYWVEAWNSPSPWKSTLSRHKQEEKGPFSGAFQVSEEWPVSTSCLIPPPFIPLMLIYFSLSTLHLLDLSCSPSLPPLCKLPESADRACGSLCPPGVYSSPWHIMKGMKKELCGGLSHSRKEWDWGGTGGGVQASLEYCRPHEAKC